MIFDQANFHAALPNHCSLQYSEWKVESIFGRILLRGTQKRETSSHEQQPETPQKQLASFKGQNGTDSSLSNTQRADKRPPEATTAAVSQPTQKYPIDFNFTQAGVMPETHPGSFPQWRASTSENQSLPPQLKLPDKESPWEDMEVECETDAGATKVRVEPSPVARTLPWWKTRAVQPKQELRQRHRKLSRTGGNFPQPDKEPSPDGNSLQSDNKLYSGPRIRVRLPGQKRAVSLPLLRKRS